jgi:hypothetical protein
MKFIVNQLLETTRKLWLCKPVAGPVQQCDHIAK